MIARMSATTRASGEVVKSFHFRLLTGISQAYLESSSKSFLLHRNVKTAEGEVCFVVSRTRDSPRANNCCRNDTRFVLEQQRAALIMFCCHDTQSKAQKFTRHSVHEFGRLKIVFDAGNVYFRKRKINNFLVLLKARLESFRCLLNLEKF